MKDVIITVDYELPVSPAFYLKEGVRNYFGDVIYCLQTRYLGVVIPSASGSLPFVVAVNKSEVSSTSSVSLLSVYHAPSIIQCHSTNEETFCIKIIQCNTTTS